MYEYVVKQTPVIFGGTSYQVGDVISGDAARELEQPENVLRIRNTVRRKVADAEPDAKAKDSTTGAAASTKGAA